MFRQVFTFALVVLMALANLTVATAEESKKAGGNTKGPPKELTVDLGGGVKLEMVLIVPGEFDMGASSNNPCVKTHRVRINKPYYLGKYLVTQKQWEAVMGNNPSNFTGPNNPVEQVSWNDCQQFLDKLTKRQGNQAGRFQLPTEAQWEYACRAGSTTRYYFGDSESGLDEYAWYAANSGKKTHAVGEKRPNAWGLYDMHGNVWEWCQDCEEAYPVNVLTDDPTAVPRVSLNVIRGGSWRIPGRDCRSAVRSGNLRGDRLSDVGFRASLGAADE
jgi:formylglycine-generating enzyme required for sulfatase activity